MTRSTPRGDQRGVVLIIGMVLLVLITLFVVAAYRMSIGNLIAVGNMQFRAQALAAAEIATERVLGLAITNSTFPSEAVDLNGDGTPEYSVNITRSCLRATPIIPPSVAGTGSSVSLGFAGGATEYNALFDYAATVSDTTTGAAAVIHQGFKARLTQPQCDTACPPATSQPCS